jgi:F-type H+-transporting ATPase subunit b
MASLAPAFASGGLTDPHWALTVFTIVLFALFAAVMKKFAWGPILQVIEERESSIRNALEGAQKARDEASALLEKHREMVRDVGREREDILKRALGEGEQIKNDIVEKAKVEGEHMVARAREAVQRERALAITELRTQVADLAILAAAKIVTSSLTPEAQRKLVDDFVKTVPQAGAAPH